MFSRVALSVGTTMDEKEEFYDLLSDFKFVPGGRILASAGSGVAVTAYNCYVIPVSPDNEKYGNDSRESILDTTKKMVGIMARGGGVGINWSTLRPSNARVVRVNGTASGPIGWMDVASRAVGEVIQGGSRRGAAMFMLNDWHPDVLNFINAKRKLDKINNANISVAISDEFMEAVKNDDLWTTRFPDTNHPDYDKMWDGDIRSWEHNGLPVIRYATVRARDIWRAIAESAWDNGEPGVVFLDRAQRLSTANGIERIISVNPCGEQPLGAYSVCNLGSMNLDRYVKNGKFNFTDLAKDARSAVRFLDRVIDQTYYLEELPETERIQRQTIRRIGLGVMGLADALIRLGIRYGSPEAVDFTGKVFYTLKVAALKESNQLAKELGPAEGWKDVSASAPYLQELPTDLANNIDLYGLRNLLVLTQAPTGTTSMLAGVNSGIEPYFSFGYWREDRLGKRWVDAPIVEQMGEKHGPLLVDGPWVSANEVTTEEHIAMQAAAQRFVDSSISKTINAPNEHTVEDVEKAFMLAWDSNLKGIAYFRDGCGRAQVLSREGKEEREPHYVEPADCTAGGAHDTYRKDGCVYCRNCEWSACTV
jgi:ribonucleoside-diphosphate reductase alpha chain